MTHPRRRLLWLTVVAVVLIAVLLRMSGEGLGGDDASGEGDDDGEPAVLPLLGTTGEVPDHAALAVKIDTTDAGRPQAGLNQADVVVEEVVEGGLTRLLALFQSQDPPTVGPVRSARSTDLALLAELGRPLFAWSGANPTFRADVEAADLIDVGVDAAPDAYRRDGGRRAPYNLFAAPEALRSAASGDEPDAAAAPPPPLFEYRPAGEPPAGPGVRPTGGLHSQMLATAIGWSWNAQERRWERSQNGTPHVDADGARVSATNVVVRLTPYRDSGVRDSRGAVVPEAETVGEGDAWVLSGGQAQPGRWHKDSADAPTTYTDTDGGPLRLAPGRTWVELLPPGSVEVLD
jgi:hypothetical protein